MNDNIISITYNISKLCRNELVSMFCGIFLGILIWAIESAYLTITQPYLCGDFYFWIKFTMLPLIFYALLGFTLSSIIYVFLNKWDSDKIKDKRNLICNAATAALIVGVLFLNPLASIVRHSNILKIIFTICIILIGVIASFIAVYFISKLKQVGKSYKIIFNTLYLIIALISVLISMRGMFPIIKSETRKLEQPDICLFMFDTLRQDHISIYNKIENLTPNIDAVARTGVVFENAITQCSTTLPAFMSLFTGRYLCSHGVNFGNVSWIPFDFEYLPQLLKDVGYKTAGFVSGFPLRREIGFNKGFDVFDDYFRPDMVRYIVIRFLYNIFHAKRADEIDCDAVITHATNWIKAKRNSKEPLFVFIHVYTPHAPYKPPTRFSSLSEKEMIVVNKRWKSHFDNGLNLLSEDETIKSDRESIRELYKKEVKWCDDAFQTFYSTLKVTPLFNNTVLIIGADHGEGLGDHNFHFHEGKLHEELILVPLIIAGKNIKTNNRENNIVELVDILPTLADICGFKNPIDAQGKSLIPYLLPNSAAPAHKTCAFSESQYAGFKVKNEKVKIDPTRKICIRERDWKLIRAYDKSSYELYNIVQDPKELNNLCESEPDICAQMNTKLDEWFDKSLKEAPPESVTFDKEDIKALESLGYLTRDKN